MRKGENIRLRLLGLARGVIFAAKGLPRDALAKHVATQAGRAVTAAGANYQEACHAESRADFVHKVSIAAKEAGETLYWIRLMATLKNDASLEPLAREADELVAILVASSKTARSRM